MSGHLKDKEERLQQVLAALIEDSASGIPLLVEGKKDTEALRTLGAEGLILTMKTGGKALGDTLQEFEASGAAEVILLLDFDRRGVEATKRLKQDMEHAGIKPNLTFWVALRALVGHDIQCIEGLPAYIETLAKQTGRAVTA